MSDNPEVPEVNSEPIEGEPVQNPREQIKNIIQTDKEGLHRGFHHAIAHNMLAINTHSKGVQKAELPNGSASEQRDSVLDLTQGLLSNSHSFIDRDEFTQIDSTSDLEGKLVAISAESSELRSHIEALLGQLPANYGELGTQLTKLKKGAYIASVENLLYATASEREPKKIGLAEAVNDTINPRIVFGDLYAPLTLAERRLLGLLTFGDTRVEDGFGPSEREKMFATYKEIDQNHGGSILDYLSTKGFQVDIQIPETQTIDEAVYRGVLESEIISNLFIESLKQAGLSGEGRFDGGIKIELIDEEGKKSLVVKHKLNSPEQEEARQGKSREITAPKPENRDEGAWGPYFRALVFNKSGKRYYEPPKSEIIEEKGQKYAKVVVPLFS